MKNLDSPTLNSTLFKEMDTCSVAGIEKERKDGQRDGKEKEKQEGMD